MKNLDIKLGRAAGYYQIGQRQNQEDARYPDTDHPSGTQRCFIVCDGVGGLDKGEVASSTVAKAMGEFIDHYDLSREFTVTDLAYALNAGYDALEKVNRGASLGMATTLTLLVAHAGGIMVAHIGDSRIYQIRPGVGVVFRTYDHSLVNVMVRNGMISPEDAINHPKSNVITRCMGGSNPGERSEATTMNITDVLPGDVFLLCSDGVLHEITDADLASLVDTRKPVDEMAAILAEHTAGSTDNNTAFLVPVQSVGGVDFETMTKQLEENAAAADPDAEPAEGVDTRIIEAAEPVAEEVTAQHKPGAKEKLTGWFSNFF